MSHEEKIIVSDVEQDENGFPTSFVLDGNLHTFHCLEKNGNLHCGVVTSLDPPGTYDLHLYKDGQWRLQYEGSFSRGRE